MDEVRSLRARVGWFQLSVGLTDRNGRAVDGPVMTAIVSSGGRGVKPWIECRFYPVVTINRGSRRRMRTEVIEDELIAIMGAIIPPGGHLMIDYESGGQEQTFNELRLGVPPPATSLGARMLAAGLVGEFKDWYFSEGGHEGPRKLQANKPPDARSARQAVVRRIRELRDFSKKASDLGGDQNAIAMLTSAQQRARELSDDLHKGRALRSKLIKRENKARPKRSVVGHGRRRRPAPSR